MPEYEFQIDGARRHIEVESLRISRFVVTHGPEYGFHGRSAGERNPNHFRTDLPLIDIFDGVWVDQPDIVAMEVYSSAWGTCNIDGLPFTFPVFEYHRFLPKAELYKPEYIRSIEEVSAGVGRVSQKQYKGPDLVKLSNKVVTYYDPKHDIIVPEDMLLKPRQKSETVSLPEE